MSKHSWWAKISSAMSKMCEWKSGFNKNNFSVRVIVKSPYDFRVILKEHVHLRFGVQKSCIFYQ